MKFKIFEKRDLLMFEIAKNYDSNVVQNSIIKIH